MKKRDLNTKLCEAVRADDVKMVGELLKQGADVNAVGDTVLKATPLWIAVENAGHEISKNWATFTDELSDLFSSIPKRDRMIKRQRQVEIIKILIKARADLEKKCHDSVPLRSAVYWKDSEVVGILLKNGANPNAETFSILSKLRKKEGRKTISGYWNTVLHEAVLKNSQAIVGALLEVGANPCRIDDEGKTPGDIARKEYWDIVELLAKAELGIKSTSRPLNSGQI